MGRKRRACWRAARVAGVLVLAAAVVFARGWFAAHAAVGLGAAEGEGTSRARASVETRVPTPVREPRVSASRTGSREHRATDPPASVPANAVATGTDSKPLSWKRHSPSPPTSPTSSPPPPPPPRNAFGDWNRFGFAKNASVTVTFATADVLDMLRNWMAHAERAEMPNILVVALDERVAEWCRARGTRTMADAASTTSSTMTTSTSEKAKSKSPLIGVREDKNAFNAIGILKTNAILRLLRLGLSVLVSDVDVAWLRSPGAYFLGGQLGRASAAVSSDCLFGFEPGRNATDAFGQKPDPTNAEFNTGILLLRAVPETVALVERWSSSQRLLARDIHLNDQSHFNRVLRGWARREVTTFSESAEVSKNLRLRLDLDLDGLHWNATSGARGKDGDASLSDAILFPRDHERGLRPRYYAFSEKASSPRGDDLRIALLPNGFFPNGHAYFVSRIAERSGVTPFAVHNTYQYSGTAGKISRFRDSGLWAVDGAAHFGEPAEEKEETGAFGENEENEKNENRVVRNRQKKFLLLRYEIPGALTDPTSSLATPKGGTPETHVALMTFQMNRIRDGLLLAMALDRVLVLPPLVCTCDRWFNLLPNCTQGDARMPMLCPLDHAVLVYALEAFEGGGRYVESAFFENRQSWLSGRRAGGRAGGSGNLSTGTDAVLNFRNEASQLGNLEPLGPVAKLAFERRGDVRSIGDADADDASPSPSLRNVSARRPEPERAGFIVPDDTAALPGSRAGLDAGTRRALDALKPGSPLYFSTKFGSSLRDVLDALEGSRGVSVGAGLSSAPPPIAASDARVLVAENLSPNAFVGFDSDLENEAFHEKILPIAHEWCCCANGTVPHVPTRYQEKERDSF